MWRVLLSLRCEEFLCQSFDAWRCSEIEDQGLWCLASARSEINMLISRWMAGSCQSWTWQARTKSAVVSLGEILTSAILLLLEANFFVSLIIDDQSTFNVVYLVRTWCSTETLDIHDLAIMHIWRSIGSTTHGGQELLARKHDIWKVAAGSEH